MTTSTRWRALVAAAAALALLAVAISCAPALRSPQFEPDDYRYLRVVEELKQRGWQGFPAASVVENRWDALWWIDAGPVRFFRPVVVATYALEAGLLGFGPRGMVLVNLVIHLACTALVGVLAVRWMGRTQAALLATVLFAAMRCHQETIWYVAGRTDSLAALLVLAALVAHTGARLRWLAVPAFVLALFTKELAVVFVVAALVHDRWIRRRASAPLYAAYAAALAGFLLVRRGVVGAVELPYPYFVAPDRPEFPEHLVTQLVAYTASVFGGVPVLPFRRAIDAWPPGTAGWLVVGGAAAATALALLWRNPVARAVAVVAGASLAVTAPSYVCERYLYLPSVAIAIVAGVVVAELGRRGGTRASAVAAALLCAWAAHQVATSRAFLESETLAYRSATLQRGHLELVRPALARTTRPTLVFNFPGNWLEAQFFEDFLRVELGRLDLEVRVVTTVPRHADLGRSVALRDDGARLTLVGLGAPVMTDPRDPFPAVRLDTGTAVAREALGFAVDVPWGDGEAAWQLGVSLPRPFGDYEAIVFAPSDDPRLSLWERLVRGRYVPVRRDTSSRSRSRCARGDRRRATPSRRVPS
jgi:hypothetical protein